MNAARDIKFRFSPSSEKKVLGPLESLIMDIVWELGSTPVGAVHKLLREREHKNIAYTTVMTTMDRMSKKRLLDQDTSSSRYVYTPTLSRAEFERYVIKGVLNSLLDNYGDATVDGIIECVSERDAPIKERLLAGLSA